MNWFKVSASHLSDKKLNSFLSVLLLSFGVGIILVMLTVKQQMQDTFQNNIKGIDLVVGAKGSPLQIILSSVYHIDAPTGNVDVKDLKKLIRSPMVDSEQTMVRSRSTFGSSFMGSGRKMQQGLQGGRCTQTPFWTTPSRVQGQSRHHG